MTCCTTTDLLQDSSTWIKHGPSLEGYMFRVTRDMSSSAAVIQLLDHFNDPQHVRFAFAHF